VNCPPVARKDPVKFVGAPGVVIALVDKVVRLPDAVVDPVVLLEITL
jgi:hypothetical protein